MVTRRLVVSTFSGLAVVLVTAGIAYAAWSASGSGSGGGAARVAQSIVVTAVTPTGAAATLYPGGPAGSVYFSLQNPNPYAITLTGLQWGTPTSANTTACPNADISLDPGAPTSVSIAVGAGATVGAVQVPGVLDLAHSAPDGCQGVSFYVPVTVTGTQQ